MRELPKGIRLNNPGNMEITKDKWQGKVTPSKDPRFETFISPEMGIRAMAKDLLTGAKRGEDTVREIISAWAPPKENNTAAYISAICKSTGFSPDTLLDIDNFDVMWQLVQAIIRHENGKPQDYGRTKWYSDEVVRAGIFAAGISETPSEPIKKKTEVAKIVSAVASATAAGVSLVGEKAQAVTDSLPWFESLSNTLISYSPRLAVGLALVVVGFIVYSTWEEIKRRRKGLL